MRQLLSPVHLLPQGQDADRPGDRRAGRREGGPRGHQQQCKPLNRRLNLPHRRGQHAGHGEYTHKLSAPPQGYKDCPPPWSSVKKFEKLSEDFVPSTCAIKPFYCNIFEVFFLLLMEGILVENE